MLANAVGAGVVYVSVAKKYVIREIVSPLALIGVGNISDTNCHCVSCGITRLFNPR